MAEDGPAPGRVTAGIGAVSRGAGTEFDLPDRSVRATYVTVWICVHFYYRQLLTNN